MDEWTFYDKYGTMNISQICGKKAAWDFKAIVLHDGEHAYVLYDPRSDFKIIRDDLMI